MLVLTAKGQENLQSFLMDVLNDEAKSRLDIPGVLEEWESDISEDGHLEVKGRYTRTGNPVTTQFADDEIDVDEDAE